MELKICHIYPDIMGDRGNIACIEKRLSWRGIEAKIVKLPVGSGRSLAGFDLVYMGGAQDYEQQILMKELRRGLDSEIKAAVEDGVTFLAIDGGFQLLGNYYEDINGNCTDFIGAVDMYTVEGKKRLTGDYKFKCCDAAGGSVVVGFENHSGRIHLGNGVNPLGTVLTGSGNNGTDNGEGVLYKNIFGSCGHGPLLPKNPELCDRILLTALMYRYGTAELAPLDDTLELTAHDEMCAKL